MLGGLAADLVASCRQSGSLSAFIIETDELFDTSGLSIMMPRYQVEASVMSPTLQGIPHDRPRKYVLGTHAATAENERHRTATAFTDGTMAALFGRLCGNRNTEKLSCTRRKERFHRIGMDSLRF